MLTFYMAFELRSLTGLLLFKCVCEEIYSLFKRVIVIKPALMHDSTDRFPRHNSEQSTLRILFKVQSSFLFVKCFGEGSMQ